ncbi:phenylalanine--tRNA ligase subunit beta [Candidatus Falkowbacteria bacterium RIFOXYB2_FULL_34_18]|uniref:Phenylalanine--tRNA ligase beta subunit n=1 Tax=Candidatus Falkowbacteria bacterium RIFOXYD2_FULL_34_120 TaxID=1798007 RepID=A0A1F5TRW4_9BACT|nr:MAG: phenylalanine--tRNA ligase subunit beta [Candidatus Falkowbacteria bacterium RIFOXYB2_FULL_34_18]OGF29922.1 MAG: phenylalanine--tRNA ligase subunit beta [Candidatus Falkowbacteria bacterium RIFOXYC12_FULL_34_55]OGF37220.1 MAG: phenylalanine--tRNA ligase subunit beta [Candidatus Falkowbacteria bacterium RIFOXYC2_FULL_34_220]OGF39460.1 MAG: phenylalanine--tRNA ligase subunit beta [Candidatus Falkowbacteria bacterium RIFOXYD12_FULL_34_57]OGF41558.1 MAG: phenylalanine--tRNA ligase subunit b
MYLSLNWLKDFVKIDNKITPEEIGAKLNLHTVEVEGIIRSGDKFKNVVVGEILEVKKHPNADRLRLATVDAGGKKLHIVCGAPNIEAGQKVPVALVGAVLPSGLEIQEAKVRGEVSEGMLCAEDELGLGQDHAGILILSKDAKIGQDLAKYLKLDDVVFEVDNKSLSNRPDLWGHYGMARELSVLFDIELKEVYGSMIPLLRQPADMEPQDNKKGNKLKVSVKDKRLCPRYTAISVSGIEIKDSPKWIQDRLSAVGSRPINNIVDITNYVMLELGQPLHAFDASLVDNIIVRQTKKDEQIETLDGRMRELEPGMLVIADSEKPIAIAGIMGGANSEISEKTSEIILEAANFEPVQIRKTANKLSLRTDASSRFEKSLDPKLTEIALARTIELILESCPKAQINNELIDINNFKLNQGPIKLDMDWLNKKIGKEIDPKEVIRILEKLGFSTSRKSIKSKVESHNNILEVKIPTWRATKDVAIKEDLLEEVVRILGYNNIESTMPCVAMEFPRFNQERILERNIKEILALGAKMTEVYNYSFVDEKQLIKLGFDISSCVRIANPINENQALLRSSLVSGLLENIHKNQARFNSLSFFEIGSIFLNLEGDIAKETSGKEKLPYQEKRLGMIFAGTKTEEEFYYGKGCLEFLFSKLNLNFFFDLSETAPNWANNQIYAKIYVEKQEIGYICALKNETQKKMGLKKQLIISEINFIKLFQIVNTRSEKKYKQTEKFPQVSRDLAFVINNKILYNNIMEEILNSHEYVRAVELFDVYKEENLGKSNKSMAFHIAYQADKTLEAKEIDSLQKELIKKLEKKFNAKVRDF